MLLNFAAVLLVVIVLTVAGLIFTGTRTSVNKVKQLSPPASCQNLEFVIGDFCYDSIGDDVRIRFHARNNIENTEIDSFLLSLDYGGTIVPAFTTEGDVTSGDETNVLFTEFIEDSANIVEIKVAPRITENNNLATCDSQIRIIPGQEIGDC